MTPSRRSASWAPNAGTEWRAALRGAAMLLSPDRCGACSRATRGLFCEGCSERCRAPRGPACSFCGADWSRSACGRCSRFGRPFAFERAAALWRYGGAPQRLVRNAKLGGRIGLLPPAGRVMARCARLAALACARGREPRLVIAVPARPGGTPHAEQLAVGFAAELGLRRSAGLRRRRKVSGTQARRSGAARRQSLRGAFAARPSLVAQRHVLLVDDVLSTGGTADAAARALRVAGALSVNLVSLAS